jgi:predicted nucleic acid-binding protein
VIDASLTLTWVLPGEATTRSDDLLDLVRQTDAIVPIIWSAEIANTLVQAERRNRINSAATARYLEIIRALPIKVDPASADFTFSTTLMLARAHRLTSYDASYLELAIRLGLPLATDDEDLRRAATTTGVELL